VNLKSQIVMKRFNPYLEHFQAGTLLQLLLRLIKSSDTEAKLC